MTFRYYLTNLEFNGTEWSEIILTPTHTEHRADKLTFLCDDFKCVLRHAENYDQIIKTIGKLKGSGVTASLTISSISGCKLETETVDNLATAICELLSLATKNTVYWMRRTVVSDDGSEAGEFTRNLGSRLRPFMSGWNLIPNFLITDTGGREELRYFLGITTPEYFKTRREKGLGLAITWILDSEHQGTVEMKLIAAYMAVEHLRVRFLDRTALPTMICKSWLELLDTGLEDKIMSAITDTVGSLNDSQRNTLSNGLRYANYPPATIELEALCKQLKVTGFEKTMTALRNKLVHTGAYGKFKFPHAIKLYFGLSHVIDVCVLRLLGFDGYYQHKDTDWKPVSLFIAPEPNVLKLGQSA